MRIPLGRTAAGIALAFAALLAPAAAAADDSSTPITASAAADISSDRKGPSHGSASVSGSLAGSGGPEQELLWISLGLLGAGSAGIYVIRQRNANA